MLFGNRRGGAKGVPAAAFVAGLAALGALLVGAGCDRRPDDALRGDFRQDARSKPLAERGSRYPDTWFMRQRISAGETIPVGARTRALALLQATDSAAEDAPGVWTHVGPLNIGGRVTALALDPTDPDHVWLGAADGGVWSSQDNGSSWAPVFDDQPTLSIGALAAHPIDPAVLYVGTGEDNGGGYAYPGDGVFKTTDGGSSWIALGLAETRRIGRIAVDPIDPQRVFVAAGGGVYDKDQHRGIYRSTDGGATWSRVLFVADDAGAIDVAIDPVNPDRVYAAIWQRHSFADGWYVSGTNSGVWRSTDGGDTWARLTNGLPVEDSVGRIGLAVARSAPEVIYALIGHAVNAIYGIYRSTDGGDSWTLRSDAGVAELFIAPAYYFGNIRVDPEDPDVVWGLEVDLLKSTDGAQSFSVVTKSMHVDFHDMIVGPGRRQIVGTDGGFYASTNGGGSWSHSETLPITQFYDLGIDRLDPARRFGGAQDNGVLRTTSGGDSDWTDRTGADGTQCEVEPTDSDRVYASLQTGLLRRSTDGGRTFTNAKSGIDPNERANWVTPLATDPSNARTVYTGFQRVYRSTTSALSWTAVSPDLTLNVTDDGTGERSPDGGRTGERGGSVTGERKGSDGQPVRQHTRDLIRRTITVVAVSPLDDQILWAGTDNGHVWATDDGGTSWSRVNPPGLDLWVTDIVCDPYDARAAYLSVTGYRAGDPLPYLRSTTDLGATWSDLSVGLPQVPVNSVEADPDAKGRLFVGTDVGVWVTDDAGATWSAMNGDLPTVVVLDLHTHAPTRTIYAGTHGRSIYAYDLTQLPPPDRDGDGVVNVDDCAPDDAGAFAVPAEVASLVAERGSGASTELSWSDLAGQAGPATVYDLARGDLALLNADGGTGGSDALACDLTATSTSDPASPSADNGYYYMARGRNACGAGSWGSGSDEVERPSAAVCP